MRIRSSFILIILAAFGHRVSAQDFNNKYWSGLSIAGSTKSLALMGIIGKSYFIDEQKKFGIHPSVNLGFVQYLGNANFKTAFEKKASLSDKIQVHNLNLGTMNLHLGISYTINDKWMIGIGSDLVGYTLSDSFDGVFTPSKESALSGPTRLESEAKVIVSKTNVMFFNSHSSTSYRAELFAEQVLKETINLKYQVIWHNIQVVSSQAIGLKGNKRFNNGNFYLGATFIKKFNFN